jgi:hypothetical protein
MAACLSHVVFKLLGTPEENTYIHVRQSEIFVLISCFYRSLHGVPKEIKRTLNTLKWLLSHIFMFSRGATRGENTTWYKSATRGLF